MKLNAYSLFDRKALQYHAPFFTHTDGSAVRMLQDLVGDLNTNVGRHPSDYVLYFIGSYDDSNGQLWPEQPLRHVMDAVALVTIKERGDLFTNGERSLAHEEIKSSAPGGVARAASDLSQQPNARKTG